MTNDPVPGCARGEVSQDVFERYRLHTYRAAGYKPFVIAAMILLGRFKDVPRLLTDLATTATPRLR